MLHLADHRVHLYLHNAEHAASYIVYTVLLLSGPKNKVFPDDYETTVKFPNISRSSGY